MGHAGFISSTVVIRVPSFLLYGFNKGGQKEKKVQKGTTEETSLGSRYVGPGGSCEIWASGRVDLIVQHHLAVDAILSLRETTGGEFRVLRASIRLL